MSGDLSTIEARREAFLSFADKFVSWDEDTQSQILSLLHDMNDDWDFIPSPSADLEHAMLEEALQNSNPEDIASPEDVQRVFAKLGR